MDRGAWRATVHGFAKNRVFSSPGACSNSCASSWWCHPTISSSVIPLSSCLQSFPASRSFSMSQFFTSGGQSIGASVSTSVLPMNIQDWFPLWWTVGFPCSLRDSQESSPTPQFKSIPPQKTTLILWSIWRKTGIHTTRFSPYRMEYIPSFNQIFLKLL